MRLYKVKEGESITDIALNACGSIVATNDILTFNSLTDWSYSFNSGQEIEVPEIIEPAFYKDLQNYPASNKSDEPTISTQLLSIVSTLESILVLNTFSNTEKITTKQQYTVKEGETINDVVLNSTGSISNLDSFLIENDFNDWNPIILAGEKLKIGFVETQTNVLNSLKYYPACNSNEINNLSTQIHDLINNFANVWILHTGYWIDSGLWVDSANWKDN
jgi:hypothetical protein